MCACETASVAATIHVLSEAVFSWILLTEEVGAPQDHQHSGSHIATGFGNYCSSGHKTTHVLRASQRPEKRPLLPQHFL